jgi:hypothetical protein
MAEPRVTNCLTRAWGTDRFVDEGRAEPVSLLGRVVTDSGVLASLGNSRDQQAGTFPPVLRRALLSSGGSTWLSTRTASIISRCA